MSTSSQAVIAGLLQTALATLKLARENLLVIDAQRDWGIPHLLLGTELTRLDLKFPSNFIAVESC